MLLGEVFCTLRRASIRKEDTTKPVVNIAALFIHVSCALVCYPVISSQLLSLIALIKKNVNMNLEKCLTVNDRITGGAVRTSVQQRPGSAVLGYSRPLWYCFGGEKNKIPN